MATQIEVIKGTTVPVTFTVSQSGTAVNLTGKELVFVAGTTGLGVLNCRNASLTVNIGTAGTPPALQLQGSDDNGGTWFDIGSPLTAVASSTVKTVVNGINCQQIRARVSTAGATVVAGYVLVRGF